MANISKEKREKMIDFLNRLKSQHQDDETLRFINEIQISLNEKKYGLVWEKHSENVEEMLKYNIPVFVEDKSRRMTLAKDDHITFYSKVIIFTP
ncbi:Uncharacterised protein [Mycoplasmopsis citelli]|uniref:Uncharacterized protein n=1 Tax=Mycoplasmopsis citelli TaxID=171281 RepID=A0A449B1S3_9BACT|nr:Uncharacterised protein [Mycoplasmopsis citelli]